MIKTVRNRKRVKLETQFVTNEIAINCVVFGYVDGNFKVLLVKEEKNGVSKWGLPSTFMENDETTDCANERLLRELSIKETIFLRQLNTYCDPNRDPKHRIIIGHYALMDMEKYRINHLNMCWTMSWIKISHIHKLVHGHNAILEDSLMRLKTLVQQSPIALKLLPEKFTLPELMNLYKDALGFEIDKSNFRKKMLSSKLLIPLNEKGYNYSHRSATLYTVDWSVFDFHNQKVLGYDF